MIRIIKGSENSMSKFRLFHPHISAHPLFSGCKAIYLIIACCIQIPALAIESSDQQGLPLKLDDQLQVRGDLQDDKALIFTSAQKVEGVNDRTMNLIGKAEIRKNGTVVKGDQINYDLDTDIADVEGNALYSNSSTLFKGPRGKLKLDTKQGWIEKPNYELKTARSSGKAERADFLNEDQTLFSKPSYSTCEPGHLDWYFSSSEMLSDQAENDISGKNGTLHFFNVPVFYMPYFSFPLSGERRSGLLAPTIGLTSNNGVDITTPYYLNIAPNRDLTIYPRYLSLRGEQLGGEYRYLEPTSSGVFQAEFLPNDAILLTNRWAYSWRHVQAVAPGVIAYANINRVSDDFYADDLTRTVGQAAVSRQLTQEAGVNYGYQGWNFLTRVVKYQTLQPDPLNLVLPPYDIEPSLNASYRNMNWHGSDLSFMGNFTRFTYSGPLDAPGAAIPNRGYQAAEREFIKTSLTYPLLLTPGYYITPKITLRANSYNLEPNSNYSALSQSFVLPTTSLDAGLFFERAANEMKPIFGRNMLMTFEPRIYYVYTPYVDQSQIPLFDTGSMGFGIAQIFSENTFVGNDRIADSNKITTGVTSRLLDADTGIERVRFVVAQRLDLSGQQVGLYGNQTAVPSYSDLLFGMSTRLAGNINLDFAEQYNTNLQRSVQEAITASWRPAPRKMLNFSYRYNFDPNILDTTIFQYEVSGQWPITKSVYAIGRWNFDKVSQLTLNTLVGIEYDQDCWVARVAINRFVNPSLIATSQIFFQIEFKGLTGVGNNPINIIKMNIPGYIPVDQKPTPLSRFEVYE